MEIIRSVTSSGVPKLLVLVLLTIFFGSCSGLKKLPVEEKALVKNTIRLLTDDDRIDQSTLKNELKGLIKQTPVKKNILNPRTYGKPLTLFDETLTEETAEVMQNYLRNNKGFYKSEVNTRKIINGRRLELIYDIDLKDRAYIDHMHYESEDQNILSLIAPNQDSILGSGTPLDVKLFDREKTRIVDVLKNEGYAEFNANFLEWRGDSTANGVDITAYIYAPLNTKQHQRFEVGEINVYTEHLASTNPTFRTVETIDSITYYSKSNIFVVDPEVIGRSVSFRTGETFKKSEEFKTNRNFYRLSPYRLVTLDPYLRFEGDSLYNYNIFLTPHDNKWAFDMGANFFYSTFNQISDQDLIGFNGSIGFQNRNLAKRAINHSFGLEGTFELNLSNFSANSLGLQFNNKFEIPKIVEIIGLTKFLSNIGVFSNELNDELQQIANTEIDFSFGLTSILNFYDLRTINTSIAYNFQPNNRLRYIFKPFGLSILDTRIKDRFQEAILNNNPLLQQSFKDYLLTGFIFKELSFSKQTIESQKGTSFTFIANFEISGFENFLINKAVNILTSYNDAWQLGQLEFSEYIRLEGDVRFNKKINERSSFAARMNAASVISYWNDQVAPFVKQYYVGGPNSIRGWQLRELGPGGYSSSILNPVPGQPYYQTGDFKLEFNAEYRFDLFWFWEGALFVDAGNVWSFKESLDPATGLASRPGSKLSLNFLDQMAVSVGYGIRADFDYFLLRFDFGYKLRNPFPDPETGSRLVFTNGRYNGNLGNINFAINYPF